MDMVMRWSNEYKNNSKVFQTCPQIDLPLWTSSYQWVLEKAKVTAIEGTNSTVYTISNSTSPPLKIPDNFTTFDDFKEKMFVSYQLEMPIGKWEDGICNCRDFMKKFICKHLVGMAIRLKLTTAPAEAKNIPIGAKRKPGRPSKAKKALIVMWKQKSYSLSYNLWVVIIKKNYKTELIALFIYCFHNQHIQVGIWII